KSLHLLLAALLVTVGACNDDPLFEIPPEAPTTVGAAVQGTSANITWTPGAGATSQEVRMSPVVPVPASAGTALLVEDDQVQTFADNTTSSALFENLTSGTTYSTTVTAINGSSRTTSDPIIVQIAGSVLAPVLNSCEAAEGDPTSISMAWSAVEGAENYAVSITPMSGGDPITDVAGASDTTWLWDSSIVTIVDGETYTCQVATIIGSDTYPSNTIDYTVGGANTPPVVSISEPADASEFFNTEVITFTGSATDDEDGDLTGASLVWTSDVDAEIGTGETFTGSAAEATPGPHVITLTATDSDDATGMATVTITIVEATSAVSFASAIQPYLVDSGCTSCHGGTSPVMGIALDSYDGIVYGENGSGVPLVVIGDAAGGVLIPKLEGTHNDGAADQAYVDDSLAPWINDGAPNN
ncbi:MAG: hypothetical protein JJE01_16465, partial [Gemmatimonadetes bacterium]|nr:hypothetical protein [Gemmatimonadota bacterium]